jgi:hypothetical protein
MLDVNQTKSMHSKRLAMTLSNMGALGVRGLNVRCRNCPFE